MSNMTYSEGYGPMEPLPGAQERPARRASSFTLLDEQGRAPGETPSPLPRILGGIAAASVAIGAALYASGAMSRAALHDSIEAVPTLPAYSVGAEHSTAQAAWVKAQTIVTSSAPAAPSEPDLKTIEPTQAATPQLPESDNPASDNPYTEPSTTGAEEASDNPY
jgi:hypothetical protein